MIARGAAPPVPARGSGDDDPESRRRPRASRREPADRLRQWTWKAHRVAAELQFRPADEMPKLTRHRRLLCAVAAAGLVACAPDLGPPQTAQSRVVAGSFADLQARIFTPRCATGACHLGNPPAVWPRLDAGAAYGSVVGVASQQLPSMSLVEPRDPERSYLLLKLRGTAGANGGSGAQMPAGDAPLGDADLNAIEAWITDGAWNE